MLIDEAYLKKQLNEFNSLKTWTIEKHDKKIEFLSEIEKFEHVKIWVGYKSYKEFAKTWQLKKVLIPDNKNGKLEKYRGLKMFVLFVSRDRCNRMLYFFPFK